MPRIATRIAPPTHVATPPTDAAIAALMGPEGALPGGSKLPHPRSRASRRTLATPVVVKQPPAHAWRCDACRTPGFGGLALLEHFGRTGHAVFSPVGGL